MKLNWSFQRGEVGSYKKIPSMGEVWYGYFLELYFLNRFQLVFMHISILVELEFGYVGF